MSYNRAMTDLGLSGTEYRTIVEQAPFMVWRAGSDAKCDYFNAVWLAFTGRPLAAELGDGWAEGVHPEDLERCVRTYREAFAARRPFEMEYRLRRADGDYRWLFDRGVPFSNAHGEFAGYIGSCVDVTDRRVAEERLDLARRRELDQLRGILPVCMHCRKICDARGEWVSVEAYVRGHARVDFSHGLCPSCLKTHYPDQDRPAR